MTATRTTPTAARLRAAVEPEQRRLAQADRPLYYVRRTEAAGGAVDVTVEELPIIHLFVPDPASVLEGARVLIARTLSTDPNSFDLVIANLDAERASGALVGGRVGRPDRTPGR
jgi:hypothetical protein